MMTVAQLRDLRTEVLTTRAGEWRTVVEWGENGRAHVDRQMLAPLREKLTGETASAAETRLQLIADNCEYARLQAGLVHAALLGLAEELGEVRARLRSSLTEAAEHGYPVADDGSVSYPETLDEDGSVRYEAGTAVRSGSVFERLLDRVGLPLFGHPMVAQQLADRIGGTLQAAADIDTRYARTLRELVCDRGIVITDAMWRDAQSDLDTAATSIRGIGDAGDIPAGATPEENADWWRGLTEAEQDAFLALRPAEIGALDGLPAETRDMANRAVLQMEEIRLADELAELRRRGPGEENPFDLLAWNHEQLRLEGHLEGISEIRNRFEATGVDGLPEAYLLGFTTDGPGRAIVANGNPDHADHTAVYVPGTGSDLSSVRGDLTRMDRLWQGSDSLAPGESVSTIMWLGYDAPTTAIPLEGGRVIPDATDPSYARAAAADLTGFTAGLNESHRGDASHTTLVGHSYGSTVIGAAAQEGSLGADDVVVAGSPGMLVTRASELGVSADHVWAMEADGDIVPDAGRFFLGGDMFDVRRGPYGLPVPDLNVFPPVPSDNHFGAQQMATDTNGHSGYWDEDSGSLENQALVVVVRYDDVELK